MSPASEYIAAVERAFPLGRGVCDVVDYGFRYAVAVETRTIDGQWMRNALSWPSIDKPKSPEWVADHLWLWLERRLSKHVRAASDGRR